MRKKECVFWNNEECEKYSGFGKRTECKKFDIRDFDRGLYDIDMIEVCKESSIYGNRYFSITEENIEALRAGKVLCSIDEYGMFIALRQRG